MFGSYTCSVNLVCFQLNNICCEDADQYFSRLDVFTLGLSFCAMYVFLVQVDVIVGPLQGAEFQCLVLGNLGSFLRLCRVCVQFGVESRLNRRTTHEGQQ